MSKHQSGAAPNAGDREAVSATESGAGCVLAEHDGSQACPSGCWDGRTCIAADPTRWGAATPDADDASEQGVRFMGHPVKRPETVDFVASADASGAITEAELADLYQDIRWGRVNPTRRTIERIAAAREEADEEIAALNERIDFLVDGLQAATQKYAEAKQYASRATLLHSFNRSTGMCRCGEGPLNTTEWVTHYRAQDEPVRITTGEGTDQ